MWIMLNNKPLDISKIKGVSGGHNIGFEILCKPKGTELE